MKTRTPFALAAATMMIGTAAAQGGGARGDRPEATLYGHWKVVGVAVPDDGVQALSTNDPSYMGRTLTFSATRLSWDKPAQSSTEAPCERPTLRNTPREPDPSARATVRKIGGPALRALSVACASGSWGPSSAPAPTFLILRDGSVGLWWFDNGLLKLRRIGRK